MSTFKFDGSDFLRGLKITSVASLAAARKGVEDSVDDLKRISTDIAPIDSGDLRRSGNATTTQTSSQIIGEVTFSAVDDTGGKRFNYALYTHEADYNLGPHSAGAPGTDGYEVGNKYLERPLKGEAEKYMRWIADEIKKVVD